MEPQSERITQPIPEADLYTVLLGTNDWHQGIPMGSETDFKSRNAETILGTLGILLDHIREAACMTYDGLHPTDKGCEILATLFAERICEITG